MAVVEPTVATAIVAMRLATVLPVAMVLAQEIVLAAVVIDLAAPAIAPVVVIGLVMREIAAAAVPEIISGVETSEVVGIEVASETVLATVGAVLDQAATGAHPA